MCGIKGYIITKLADAGIMDFYSGGADGVDCWAAMIVLELRKKNPALKLHLVLPHEGQESKWSDPAQERYHSILEKAHLHTRQAQPKGRNTYGSYFASYWHYKPERR